MLIRILCMIGVYFMFSSSVQAKCRLTMPSQDWGKASKEWINGFGEVGYGGPAVQCKVPKCGGLEYVVSFKEGKIKLVAGVIPQNKQPLRFMGMHGSVESSPWYTLEAYSDGDRYIIMYSFGKNAAKRKANMALMKKSVKCD